MRNTHDRPAVPNFTQACVVLFGVNLMWILMVIWVLWGLFAVAATGWLVNQLINRIAVARG
jgi:hypothetical protein